MGLMREVMRGSAWGAARGETVSTIQQHGDGDITVATYQNTDFIMRRNAQLRNDPDYNGDYIGQKWGRRVAEIPLIVVHHWYSALGVDYMNPGHFERILQLLDDPEWAWCKTTTEKIARQRMRFYMKASTASPKVVAAKVMPGV